MRYARKLSGFLNLFYGASFFMRVRERAIEGFFNYLYAYVITDCDLKIRKRIQKS